MTARPCPHVTVVEPIDARRAAAIGGRADACTLPAGHSGLHSGLNIDWADRYHGPLAPYPPELCPICRRKADS